jgi:uncharacterized SAM-binding protein YcdF (DUF218 family)
VISRQRLISIVKGLTGGTAIWCLLATLHVLSGTMADTPGLLLLALLGLAATLVRQYRLVVATLVTLTGAVLLVSLTSIAPTIAAHWTRTSATSAKGVDAVVVLSGGLNADTTVSSEALDRLLTGLELVNRGTAPILVTTTTEEFFPTGLINSEVDQARIINSLTRPVVWLHAWGGHSTRDEATSVAALLHPKGVRRIAIVTSPMHTRRACAVFEAVEFVVSCTAARMRDASGLPAAQDPVNRLALFGQWIYEVAAMADYAAHGWLSQPTGAAPRT